MPRRSHVLLMLVLLVGCSDDLSDETPVGTLRLFLAAIERSEHDEQGLEEAYELLSRDTRDALAERAHMAGSLGGREFQPWEMLVQGRQRPNFALSPRGRGMRAHIEGDRATVTVTGADDQHRAEVPMVREQGRWRIEVAIPPARSAPTPSEASPPTPPSE